MSRSVREDALQVLAGAAGAGNEPSFSAHELNSIRSLIQKNFAKISRHGMSTAALEPRISTVEVTDELITAHLVDGRVISVPIAWSWRLSEATPAQRARFELIGDGQGVHWPEIDEDISAEGMLKGTPAPRPRRSASLLP